MYPCTSVAPAERRSRTSSAVSTPPAEITTNAGGTTSRTRRSTSSARFFSGDYEIAHGLLQELKAAHPAYYLQEVAVLSARAAAALGDSPAALRELEAVLDRSVGLEARYRYAEILWKQGSVESARNELQRLIEHAQRFKVSAAEQEWAKLARSALTAL